MFGRKIFSIIVFNIICLIIIIVIIPITNIIIILYQIRKLVVESSDDMVYRTLSCRHFPILDKRCPVEFYIKYLLNSAHYQLAILVISTVDSVQEVFANTKAVSAQGSYQFQCSWLYSSLCDHTIRYIKRILPKRNF